MENTFLPLLWVVAPFDGSSVVSLMPINVNGKCFLEIELIKWHLQVTIEH